MLGSLSCMVDMELCHSDAPAQKILLPVSKIVVSWQPPIIINLHLPLSVPPETTFLLECGQWSVVVTKTHLLSDSLKDDWASGWYKAIAIFTWYRIRQRPSLQNSPMGWQRHCSYLHCGVMPNFAAQMSVVLRLVNTDLCVSSLLWSPFKTYLSYNKREIC